MTNTAERDQLRTDLHSCQVELERVRAEAAVIREVLRDAQMHIEADNIDWARFQEGPDHDPDYKPEFPEIVKRCQDALSTDAGASLLERYREAVDLLREFRDGAESIGICEGEFLDRVKKAVSQDTLLATVKGGVE